MKYVSIWLIVFVVFYLLYLFFVILRKKKLAKFNDSPYIRYLAKAYKLDLKKLNTKKAAHLVALANSFIIATTFLVVFSIENYFLVVCVAILAIIPLSLLVYYILGKILKRGEK